MGLRVAFLMRLCGLEALVALFVVGFLVLVALDVLWVRLAVVTWVFFVVTQALTFEVAFALL